MKRKMILTVITMAFLAALYMAGAAMANGELQIRWLLSSAGGEVSGDGLALRSAVGQSVIGEVRTIEMVLCSGHLCTAAVHAIYLPLITR